MSPGKKSTRPYGNGIRTGFSKASGYGRTSKSHLSNSVYGQAKQGFADVLAAFRSMDSSITECYKKKGLRAWHDHLLLHLQKFVYAVFFTIAAIMLVVQGDAAGGDPCKMPDLYSIFKFCVYPMYMDLGIVTINVMYLIYRSLQGEEKILEVLMEPRMRERLLIHMFPLIIVVLLALTAQSVPLCFLSADYRDTGFCRAFSVNVVKGFLIAIAVLSFVHLFTNVYHHRRLTKEIDLTINGNEYSSVDAFEKEPFLDANSQNPNDGIYFPMKSVYRN